MFLVGLSVCLSVAGFYVGRPETLADVITFWNRSRFIIWTKKPSIITQLYHLKCSSGAVT